MDWEEKENYTGLHPFPVILGVISGLNNSDILVDVINRSGLQVNWGAPGYSHTTRIREYIPCIQAAYANVSEAEKLALASLVVDDLAQRYTSAYEQVKLRIEKIGWRIENGRLLPGDVDIQEMFFPRGSEHDAYREIRAILQRAKGAITIIDPYVDGTLFQLLSTHSGSTITVHILGFKLPSDFGLEAKKFLTQYPHFQIEVKKTKEFHDRFIILDDSDCFHIGASIKDAGGKAFMISQVEDSGNRDALLKQHYQAWAVATQVAL